MPGGEEDGEVINCALDFTKTTKKCMEQEAEAAQQREAAAAVGSPSARRRHGGERQAGQYALQASASAGASYVVLQRCALT